MTERTPVSTPYLFEWAERTWECRHGQRITADGRASGGDRNYAVNFNAPVYAENPHAR